MTTVYIDLDSAVDGDGSLETPRNVIPSITSGNEYLFAAGNTVGAQVTVAADNVTIGSWGLGRARFSGGGAVEYGVYAMSVSGLTVQDLDIDNMTKGGVLVENDAAGVTDTNIVLRRLTISNIGLGSPLVRSNEQSIRVGTGICVGSGPTVGTSVIDGVTIEDCDISNCGAHGIDIRWRVLNVTRRRCHVYRTGLWVGSHGITSHPISSTITSGWTLDSGTIYSRSRVSTNDVERLLINTTDSQMLTKVAGTTPSSGQWSVDATKIYVNIGGSVAGKSFFLKRHAHGPFIDEDHRVHGVVDYDGIEGHGIDTDDGSGPCTIRRCISYENEGDGFYSFRGESVTREACVAIRNAKRGFGSLLVQSPADRKNTAKDNAQRGFQWDGGSGGSAYNCCAIGNAADGSVTTGTGFNVSVSHAGFTHGGLAVYANLGTTQVNNVTADTSDTMTNADGVPLPGSPLLTQGADLGPRRDIRGFQSRKHIGAYGQATLMRQR